MPDILNNCCLIIQVILHHYASANDAVQTAQTVGKDYKQNSANPKIENAVHMAIIALFSAVFPSGSLCICFVALSRVISKI